MRAFSPYANLTKQRQKVISVLPLFVLYSVTLLVLRPPDDLAILLLGLTTAPLFIWLSLRDMASFEIPDTASFGIALISMVYLIATDANALPLHMFSGLLALAFFWLFGEVYFRRAGTEGLGIGDAKLFGACVFLLGPLHAPGLLLIASVGGIIAHFATRSKNNNVLPFGPFIAYATFVLMFLEPLFFQSIS